MKTLSIFIAVIIFICIYILYYHKIDTTNFLDVIHTGFVRQFVFELIPFIIMFGVRDLKFLDTSNTGNFFNSLIGRSILGMIGFTFVSYAITTISPKKTPPLIPFLDSNNSLKLYGGAKIPETFTSSNSFNPFKTFNKNNNKNYNNVNGNEKLLPFYLL